METDKENMTDTTTATLTNAKRTELVPGDIMDSTWGYEQTNIDFYVVVRATAKTVWLQKVGSTITAETGWMRGRCIPDVTVTDGEVFRRKIHTGGTYGIWIELTSYSGCSLWDGDERSWSADR